MENGNMQGHNVNGGLTDDQNRALGFHHQGLWNKALAAKKLHDAALKNCAKRALADGVSVDDIKLLNRLDTPEGEASLRAELERQLEVARWVGAEVGTQFSLIDEPDRTPLEDRAREEGKVSGMKAESLQSPYDGPAGQAFAEGWHEGQAALFSIQGLSEAREAAEAAEAAAAEAAEEPEEDAAPKKRGRPKLSDEEKAARRAAKKNGAHEEPADEHAADKARDAEAFKEDPFPVTA